MDPQATLDRLRSLISAYFQVDNSEQRDDIASDVIEAVEALDNWLSSGGFLPRSWAKSGGVR